MLSIKIVFKLQNANILTKTVSNVGFEPLQRVIKIAIIYFEIVFPIY